MTTVFLVTCFVALSRAAIRVHPHTTTNNNNNDDSSIDHAARLTQLQLIEAQLKSRLTAAAASPGAARPTLRSVSQEDREAKAAATRVAASVAANVAKTVDDRAALNEARLRLNADDEAFLADGDSLHVTLRKQLASAKATLQQLHGDASEEERLALERKLDHKFSELLHSVQSSRMHDAVDPAVAAAVKPKPTPPRVDNDADAFAVDLKARFARIDKAAAEPPQSPPQPPPPPLVPKAPPASGRAPPVDLASHDELRSKQNSNYLRRQKERLKSEL